MSRNPQVQILKSGKSDVVLDSDFDGTSTTVDLDGDRPVVGLAINLSTGATLTFQAVVAGVDHKVLKSDGTELSIDASTNTEIYRFFPEIAGVRKLKITSSSSQTNATVYGFYSS